MILSGSDQYYEPRGLQQTKIQALLFCVEMDLLLRCIVCYVCFSYVRVREKKTEKGKREGKQINVSALYLNRLLSLGGECQVGPP